MAEQKKEIVTSKDMLTVSVFRKKFGFEKAEQELVSKAFTSLYKRGIHAKAPAGYLAPIVHLNKAAHSSNSRYKVPVYFSDYVLKEVEAQRKLAAKRNQGAEK